MNTKILTLIIIGFLFIAGVFVLLKQLKGGESTKLKMQNEKLKILMIVAPKDFRDEEYSLPKEIFENAGVEVTVASKDVTQAIGMFGATADVGRNLSQVQAADYDAVVFVGGSGAAIYFDDSTAHKLAKDTYEQNKVVGAICIAPSILANSGILQGKQATAFSSEQENLESRGAIFTGEAVTVDGKIITANGPEAASAFGQKIVEVLEPLQFQP